MLSSLDFDSKKKGRRLGRGHSSSKGKTCGRGHKGQKCRSGGRNHGLKKKQSLINKRILGYGFKCRRDNDHTIKSISLSLLSERLLVNYKCSINNLRSLFNLSRFCYVKLLDGEINIAGLVLECDLASDNAILKVSNLGGKIILSNVLSCKD